MQSSSNETVVPNFSKNETKIATKDEYLAEIIAVRNNLMPGATDAELKLLARFCRRTGLCVFSRQVTPVKMNGKWNFLITIDGFRVIAEKTGLYAGQSTPEFYNGKTWVDVWTSDSPPLAARVSVYRKDFKEPVTCVARFSSYLPDRGGFAWKKMPEIMISKCAEALALRKAFPNDLSGVYSVDEMEQAMVNTKAKTFQIESKNQKPRLVKESDIMAVCLLGQNNGINITELTLSNFAKKEYGLEGVYDLNVEQLDVAINRINNKISEFNQIESDEYRAQSF